MENFFKTKGELSVIIGEGYISSFEAAELKKGDVLISAQLAGKPCKAIFNGEAMFEGEIVIIDGVFGLRVTSTAPAQSELKPSPIAGDNAIEMLPTTIKLASVDFSLEELREAGIGSIINLNKKFDPEENAELFAAGIPLAKGAAAVYFENMGIKINDVFENEYAENNIRSSGYIIDPLDPEIKIYNFLRPDKFTRNSIMKIKEIHQTALKTLKVRRPEFSDYTISLIDQCTLKEAMDDLSGEYGLDSLLCLETRFGIWKRQDQNKKDYVRAKGKPALQPVSCKNRWNEECLAFMEKLGQRRELDNPNPVYFFAVNDAIPYKLLNDENIGRPYFLSCLRGGWKNCADMDFQSIKTFSPEKEDFGIPKTEMIIILRLAANGDKNNAMYLIYPYISLESVIALLD